jgi:hypothetical protein
VAADVLAHEQDGAGGVEGGRGVDGAGQAEQLLVGCDPVGHRRHHVERDRRRRRQGVQALAQLVDGGRAAHAARRGGDGQAGRRDRRPAAGVDRDDVELALERRARPAVLALADRGAGQQALGEAEARRQLEVVAGRAHGRGDEHAVEVDLERLLHHQLVGPARQGLAVEVVREHLGRATAGHVPRLPAVASVTPWGADRAIGRSAVPPPGRTAGQGSGTTGRGCSSSAPGSPATT